MKEVDLLMEMELHDADMIMETYLREADIPDSDKNLLSQAWDMIKTADSKLALWKKAKAVADHTAKSAGDVYDKAKALSESIVGVIPMPKMLKGILGSVLMFVIINSILGPVGGVATMGLGKMASTYKKEAGEEASEEELAQVDAKIRAENDGDLAPEESQRTKEYIDQNKESWEAEAVEQVAQILHQADKLRQNPGYVDDPSIVDDEPEEVPTEPTGIDINTDSFQAKVRDIDAMFGQHQQVAESMLCESVQILTEDEESQMHDLSRQVQDAQQDPGALKKFMSGLKTIKDWSADKYRQLLDWGHDKIEARFPFVKKMPRKWRERWAGWILQIILAFVVAEVVQNLMSGNEQAAEEAIANTVGEDASTDAGGESMAGPSGSETVTPEMNEFTEMLSDWSWDDPDQYQIVDENTIAQLTGHATADSAKISGEMGRLDLARIVRDLAESNPGIDDANDTIDRMLRTAFSEAAVGDQHHISHLMHNISDKLRMTQGQTHSLYKALQQFHVLNNTGQYFN